MFGQHNPLEKQSENSIQTNCTAIADNTLYENIKEAVLQQAVKHQDTGTPPVLRDTARNTETPGQQ